MLRHVVRWGALSATIWGATHCGLVVVDGPPQRTSCIDDLDAVYELELDADPETAKWLRTTLSATVHLRRSAEMQDGSVANLCASVARDLGAEEPINKRLAPGARSSRTCEHAATLVKQRREKTKSVFLTYSSKPLCAAALTTHARCARDCDPSVPDSQIEVECAPDTTSGECSGLCTGACYESFPKKCDARCFGTCKGACLEGFLGTCGGVCTGTCDGNTVNGKCDGRCDGKCSSNADGNCQSKCQGECSGSCVSELKAGPCNGTCAGSCSKPMAQLQCDEFTFSSRISPACTALCDAEMIESLNCTASVVEMVPYLTESPSSAEALSKQLRKRLGALLEVETGKREVVDRAFQRVEASLAELKHNLGSASEESCSSEAILDPSAELDSVSESARPREGEPEQAKATPLDTCLADATRMLEHSKQVVEQARLASQSMFAAVKGDE